MLFSRHLTTGEIALARQVFGDSIDYAAVKIHNRPYVPMQPANSGMTPDGEIYMRDCYKADYSREDVSWRGLFIHEMAHVWQYQNKIFHPVVAAGLLQLKHKFNYAAAYDFELNKKKDLTDYGMEQQAAIIQQYYVLKQSRVNVRQYEEVLRRFLGNPSYARQKNFFRPFWTPKF